MSKERECVEGTVLPDRGPCPVCGATEVDSNCWLNKPRHLHAAIERAEAEVRRLKACMRIVLREQHTQQVKELMSASSAIHLVVDGDAADDISQRFRKAADTIQSQAETIEGLRKALQEIALESSFRFYGAVDLACIARQALASLEGGEG